MGTKKQRQRRYDGARLTESGNARSEQLNTHGAHRVANQQSCLPEWIRTSKAQLVFRYEISDLFYLYVCKIRGESTLHPYITREVRQQGTKCMHLSTDMKPYCLGVVVILRTHVQQG